jgi:hypothetical protein
LCPSESWWIGVTLRELGQPLGRSGQELGHHGVQLAQIPPPGQRVEREGLRRQGAITAQRRFDRRTISA